ncbi:MAG TPA: S8 family serine peptidase [Bacteroidales bacterium]|nr:S8 family serine peptidase [Bacteroidales bacterium]HOR82203.1 S8 family serine peptidase [Bacteroidales bacterium]HPJ91347.1 S8 family serine peptidase [Bacteroidales bacterium]HQB19717.1 S8 family serine peptidase [Bacteroidales bacterium]
MFKCKTLIIILFALSVFNLYSQTISPDFKDGMIYVKLTDDFPLDKIAPAASGNPNETTNGGIITKIPINQFSFLNKLFKRYNVISIHRPFTIYENPKLLRILQIEFNEINDIESFITDLGKIKEIEYAEKIPIDKICWTPNDPLYSTNIDGGNMRWHLDMIKADSAWDVQKGSASIKVAVVDNFIWGDHPDLLIDSVNLCKISYDSDLGYTSTLGNSATIPPASYTSQSSTQTAYSASHGTHCAGLVGAINDNGIGIASIGGGVTLMGVRAASDGGTLSYTYQGVQWAAGNGAKVISMSFGSSYYSQTIEIFLQVLYEAGIVLVGAAGNEGDQGNPVHYPSEYASVISVASVNGDKKLSYFSQHGDRAEIAAPGGFIRSITVYPNVLSTTFCKSYFLRSAYPTLQNTYYDGMQGTSMACPMAAGLCGLMLSKDSTLSPQEIKYRLQKTALPLHPASSTQINGNGYINAYAALTFKELLVRDTVYFSKNADISDTIHIKATDSWQILDMPSWITIDDSIGTKGISVVKLTTNSENTGSENREAMMQIQMDDIVKDIRLIQLNYDLYINNNPHYVVFSGGKINSDTIIINSNVDWKVSNSSSWLGINKTSGNGNDTIIIHSKSANTWGYNRLDTMYIQGLNFMYDSVIIMQKIPDFLKWNASFTQIGPATTDTVSIMVYSNVNWSITGDYSWIEPDKTTGSDSMLIIFTILEDNTSGEEKIASFDLTNGKITKNLKITQKSDLSINNLLTNQETILYPNPTSTTLNIQNTAVASIRKIVLYDVLGNLIVSYHDFTNNTISIAHLSKGVYIVAVLMNDNSVTYQKIIKL